MSEYTTADRLNYLRETKQKIREALETKGITITDEDTFRSYADKILEIVSGTDTSDATATEADILLGKTAYVNGVKLTGTYDTSNIEGIGTSVEEVNQLADDILGEENDLADDILG